MHHRVDRLGNEDKVGDVMPDEIKTRAAGQVGQIVRATGDEIIHTDHFVAFVQ